MGRLSVVFPSWGDFGKNGATGVINGVLPVARGFQDQRPAAACIFSYQGCRLQIFEASAASDARSDFGKNGATGSVLHFALPCPSWGLGLARVLGCVPPASSWGSGLLPCRRVYKSWVRDLDLVREGVEPRPGPRSEEDVSSGDSSCARLQLCTCN